jgi:hypothetical protein
VSEWAARELYGFVAGDPAASARARAALRAERLATSIPTQDDGRCRACGAAARAARELPLSALGEAFARCREDYALRELVCGGCAAVLATEVVPAGFPRREAASSGPSFTARAP